MSDLAAKAFPAVWAALARSEMAARLCANTAVFDVWILSQIDGSLF
jgi:hypothetical protein